MNRLWLIGLIVISSLLLSCEDDEQNDLAKAQRCLDDVDQTRPAEAEDCLSYISTYSSQHANILKCSIYMTSGGLVENKIVQGYKALKDDAQTNKEAAFMAVLALTNTTPGEGYTKAVLAKSFCDLTDVKGLMYLANVILAGTIITRNLSDAGVTFNINDPSSIKTAVDGFLADCSAAVDPLPAKCTQNMDQLGGAMVTVAESYCNNDSADSDVCTKVNDAVAAAGGVPANVGEALYCYLNKKTYVNGLCQ